MDELNKVNNFIKERRANIKREFGLLIMGAILFTASFLWKDYFTDIKDAFFPKTKRGLIGKGLYVLAVTTILVLIVVFIKDILRIGSNQTNSQFDDGPIDETNQDLNMGINALGLNGNGSAEGFVSSNNWSYNALFARK